jgi:hypothetical protein
MSSALTRELALGDTPSAALMDPALAAGRGQIVPVRRPHLRPGRKRSPRSGRGDRLSGRRPRGRNRGRRHR